MNLSPIKKLIYLLILLDFFLAIPAFSQAYGWAVGIGGSNDEYGTSIKTDSQGNSYAVGYFNGTVDFDPGIGILNITAAGSEDMFISKFSPAGDLIWVKRIGGEHRDHASSIEIDQSGNLIITGSYGSVVDFDPGPAVFNLTTTWDVRVFVSKFTSNGELIWAKSMGGTNAAMGLSVDVDNAGNIYTTGSFSDVSDFDPGLAVYTLTPSGSYDIFISKLDSSGNFVWAKQFGGPRWDKPSSLGVDNEGNVVLTGAFSGTIDFDPGIGTVNLTATSEYGSDIFICKLTQTGQFLWVQRIGGTGYDDVSSMAISSDNAVVITGYFDGTVDFDPGPGTANLTANSYDCYVCKISSTGQYIWAKRFGRNWSAENGKALSIDKYNNVFITGTFNGTIDFDPDIGVTNLTSTGTYDTFICKISEKGDFIWARRLGGIDQIVPNAIDVDRQGNVFITGDFGSYNPATIDFDPGPNTAQITGLGRRDIFICKLQATEPIRSVASGIWTNPTIWNCGCMPNIADLVYVSHNIVVPSNGNKYSNRIIFETGGQIRFTTLANILLHN